MNEIVVTSLSSRVLTSFPPRGCDCAVPDDRLSILGMSLAYMQPLNGATFSDGAVKWLSTSRGVSLQVFRSICRVRKNTVVGQSFVGHCRCLYPVIHLLIHFGDTSHKSGRSLRTEENKRSTE